MADFTDEQVIALNATAPKIACRATYLELELLIKAATTVLDGTHASERGGADYRLLVGVRRHLRSRLKREAQRMEADA